jgi:NTE family protein
VKRALVLAGGGVAGIAWELGVLLGLRDQGVDVSEADLVVGTSAGAAVAAQVTGTGALESVYAAQLAEETVEIDSGVDLQGVLGQFAKAMNGVTSPQEARQRIGALALAAQTVPEAARREVIAGRLPSHTWPERPMLLTAIDTETGDLRVFDRACGVDLVDVVAASCAVPGIWPPVTIEGRRYMDGGMRSGSNADLAAGAQRVLVITPSPPNAPALLGSGLDQEIKALDPADVHVLYADEASVAAFGQNPLLPTTRRPSALAGREVGRRHAAEVAAFWG